jgi:hypothetical protein
MTWSWCEWPGVVMCAVLRFGCSVLVSVAMARAERHEVHTNSIGGVTMLAGLYGSFWDHPGLSVVLVSWQA